jgi:hypothetical protein
MTTKTLAKYLGNPATALLAEAPFKDWIFTKSFEQDLDEPLFDYVFAQNGVDFVCNGDEKVTSIFLYSDESRCFKEGLHDLPFSATRQEVIDHLGSPSKSGGRINDPILGEYGAWDRFEQPGYAIHVEYRMDADHINKITLMRADFVP